MRNIKSGTRLVLVVITALTLICLWVLPALAQEQAVVFNPDNKGEYFLVDFDEPDDLLNALDEDTISSSMPSYNGSTSGLSGRWDGPGVAVAVNMPAGSEIIFLDIPALNLHEVFTGADRTAALNQAQQWYATNGDATVAEIEAIVEANQPEAEGGGGGGSKSTLFSGCFIGTLLD